MGLYIFAGGSCWCYSEDSKLAAQNRGPLDRPWREIPPAVGCGVPQGKMTIL